MSHVTLVFFNRLLGAYLNWSWAQSSLDEEAGYFLSGLSAEGRVCAASVHGASSSPHPPRVHFLNHTHTPDTCGGWFTAVGCWVFISTKRESIRIHPYSP